jgi:hypothetical protein
VTEPTDAGGPGAPPEPSGPPLGMAVLRSLRARVEALEHENAHLHELVQTLRRLVGDAFEEGFRARAPDTEEPWLVDWLQSQSKARLAEHFARPAETGDIERGAGEG